MILVDGKLRGDQFLGKREHIRGPKPKGVIIKCKACGRERYMRPYFAAARLSQFCSHACASQDAENRWLAGRNADKTTQLKRQAQIAGRLSAYYAKRSDQLWLQQGRKTLKEIRSLLRNHGASPSPTEA